MKAARIVAALHGDQVQGVRHRGVGDLDDPDGAGRAGPARAASRALLDRARAPLDVEPHLAAEEVIRVEPSEHDVGVGDGRLGPSAP